MRTLGWSIRFLMLAATLLLVRGTALANATYLFNFDTYPNNTNFPEAFPSVNFSGGAATTMSGPRSSPIALQIYGNDNATNESYGYYKVYDVNIPVVESTTLEYYVEPLWSNGVYVAVDLIFDDGSALRDSGAVDQYGVRVHPAFQGAGGHLALYNYNRVASNIGQFVRGRTIKAIVVGFDHPAGTGWVNAQVDDITIANTGYAFNFDDLANFQLMPAAFPAVNVSASAQVTMTSARSQPYSLQFTGTDNSTTTSYAYFKLYDTDIPVAAGTKLEYQIMPLFGGGTYVAVDLILDDGTALRDSGAVDQYGIRMHPTAQGLGGKLGLNAYQRIVSNIGSCLAGRRIKQVLVGFDQPASTGFFNAILEDIKIYDDPTVPVPPSGSVWIQGSRVDEQNKTYSGATLTVGGAGSTCGPHYSVQSGSTCPVTAAPYVAKGVIDANGQVTVSTPVPSGKTVLVSVCADGTGYPGQYECLGHSQGSYCRATVSGSTASIKLSMLPNRVPRYVDVWWKYIPTNTNWPACDVAGYTRSVATAGLPSGSRGDIDGDGYLTIADGVRGLRCAAGLAIGTPGTCLPAGDFNQSGQVTVSDAAQVLRLVAGKTVPEPYTVKPVYIIPTDQEFDTCYKAKLQQSFSMIQQFYGERMQALGYGYRPFNMELEPDGRARIYLIRGKRPLSGYLPADGADFIFNDELRELFDFDKSLLAVENEINGYKGFPRYFPDHGSTAYVQGLIDYAATTLAGQNAIFCDTTPDPGGGTRGAHASAAMGGLAHEMGHAFGSYHQDDNIQPGVHQLMGLGNYTFGRYFVSCPAPGDRSTSFEQNLGLLLNNSAFFRTPTSYTDVTQPTVTLTLPASVPTGQPVTMTVSYADAGSGPRVMYVIADVNTDGSGILNAHVEALNGNGMKTFVYTPPQTLAPGNHQVSAYIYDDASNPIAITKTLVVTP